MTIAIVGTGYVGLVSAACFADVGHTVIGVDIDEKKVAMLRAGKSPIYEPELEEMLRRNLANGRLRFTTSLDEALPHVSILFSAVPTPPGEGYKADLRAVFTVAETVARSIEHDLIFVNKSTVPVGTGKECEKRIRGILTERKAPHHVTVVSNPEFLREGLAVSDTLTPDRIVVGINREGAAAHTQHVENLLHELYQPFTKKNVPLLFMTRESAEIVKYASNAFLATKISFINMLTELTEKSGARIQDVAEGMGLDHRIGPKFLCAGIGYGGSCFPKDVKALLATGKEYDIHLPIVEATDAVNAYQRQRFIEKVLSTLPPKQNVAVWGLSFKPETDDMREAPSIDVLHALVNAGHSCTVFDPVAMDRARPLLPQSIAYATSAMEALHHASALLVLTEWNVFKDISLSTIKSSLKGPYLFDGRNIYRKEDALQENLLYVGVGV